MRSWYVVYSRPREETVAAENLTQQGFENYWPCYRKQISHAGRISNVTAGVFPRYLFVRFDADEVGWRAIRSTRGVVDLVRNGAGPSQVAEGLIRDIRAREDEEGFVVLGRQIALEKGCRIGLRGEAFKGHELIFEAQKDADRVMVLMRLLGREFSVEVPVSAVAPPVGQ